MSISKDGSSNETGWRYTYTIPAASFMNNGNLKQGKYDITFSSKNLVEGQEVHTNSNHFYVETREDEQNEGVFHDVESSCKISFTLDRGTESILAAGAGTF